MCACVRATRPASEVCYTRFKVLWAFLFLLLQTARPNFVIGPDDVLDVQVFQVPELSRTIRVDQKGFITLPLLGPVKVEGLSPGELERQLSKLLSARYLNDPQVSIFVRELKSNPVSVLGAVKMPGVYQIPSPKSLAEIVAMAQGLMDGPAGKAGDRILVTHGERTTEIGVLELLRNEGKAASVLIYPGDQVRVLPADVVYVLGDVIKPGGYTLETHQQVNVVQALALAGGPTRTAKLKDVVIYRKDAKGEKSEIPVQLRKKLSGPDSEKVLQANDILFIPGSVTKRVFSRALDLALVTVSGVVIWRR